VLILLRFSDLLHYKTFLENLKIISINSIFRYNLQILSFYNNDQITSSFVDCSSKILKSSNISPKTNEKIKQKFSVKDFVIFLLLLIPALSILIYN